MHGQCHRDPHPHLNTNALEEVSEGSTASKKAQALAFAGGTGCQSKAEDVVHPGFIPSDSVCFQCG